MQQKQGNPVIKRKLGLRARAVGPSDPCDARQLARALARATSAIPGLVGSCADPVQRVASIVELLELVEGEAFVAVIANPSGGVGLAIFDPISSVALIEALTIGRLSRRAPPNRRATQTDALLLSDVIDTTLEEFDRADTTGAAHRTGFRFQRFPSDYRLLELLLEASRFDLIVQPLALLGDDVRRDGQFILALPKKPAVDAVKPDAHAARRGAVGTRNESWAQSLEAQVMGAQAELTAVLGRVTMPLSEVMALGHDSRVVLPLAMLEEVEMRAIDGQILGRGRLGQFRAMRAIRLTDLGAPAIVPVFEDHAKPIRPAADPSEAPPLKVLPPALD